MAPGLLKRFQLWSWPNRNKVATLALLLHGKAVLQQCAGP